MSNTITEPNLATVNAKTQPNKNAARCESALNALLGLSSQSNHCINKQSLLMRNIQLIIFIGTVDLVLVIYALLEFYAGSSFNGISLLLGAIWFSWIALTGLENIFKCEFANGIAFLAILVSVIGAFVESDFTDLESTQANTELLSKSVRIKYCTSHDQPNRHNRELFNKHKDELLMKCGLQNIHDAQELNFTLFKSLHLDPFTSSVDIILNSSNSEREPTCQEFARALDHLCPGVIGL